MLPMQVPRALKQSAAPVDVIPNSSNLQSGLAQEYGMQVRMGTSEGQLQVPLISACKSIIHVGIC